MTDKSPESLKNPNNPWNRKNPKSLRNQENPKSNSSGNSPETEAILDQIDSDFARDKAGIRVLSRARQKNGRGRRIASNVLIAGGILLILVPLAVTGVSMKRNADAMDAFLSDTSSIVDAAQASTENVDAFYQSDVDFSAVGDHSGTLDPAVASSGAAESGTAMPATTQTMAETASGAAIESAAPATSDTTSGTSLESAAPAVPTKAPLMSKEEIQKKMIGVLFIDKIKVRMPVITGVDEETLRVAAGRMPESGKLDKIGNVVLAGHRSYTFGKYFNRLDELQVGDTFTIKTGTKTLEYTIYKKFVVEPNDFSILNYNKTDKICTLFTCTPVVIANKRLVVQAIQTN
jgi:sortase A